MLEIIEHEGRTAPAFCERMHPRGILPVYMTWQEYDGVIATSTWDVGGLVHLLDQQDLTVEYNGVAYTKVNVVLVRGPVPDGRYQVTNTVTFEGSAVRLVKSAIVIVSDDV